MTPRLRGTIKDPLQSILGNYLGNLKVYFDDERDACKIVILDLFGFFMQQIALFTHRTYAYIKEIDNEQ